MKEQLAKNIYRYRKEKNLTQEKLARLIGVTYQAISKWENAQTMPDMIILPKLSEIFEISIDKLLGYPRNEKSMTIYEEEYKENYYYWGIKPSKMCLRVLDLIPPINHIKLLDIGCGEGRNAVFFARNGYDVTAFDITSAGIEKTRQLAEKYNVNVKVFKADILDFRLNHSYDVLFSSGVLHYIKPEFRDEILSNYKKYTNLNGFHFFNVFVNKPFIEKAPDHESTAFNWSSGELFTHYHDWLIDDCSEEIFDCYSSGVLHQHAMNKIFAKKIN